MRGGEIWGLLNSLQSLSSSLICLLNMNPCCTQHRSHTYGLISWVKKCEASYYDDGTEKDGDKEVLVSLSSWKPLSVFLSFSCGKAAWSRENASNLILQSIHSAHYSQFACFLTNIHQSSFFLSPLSVPPFMSPSHIYIYTYNKGKPHVCTDTSFAKKRK